MVRAFDTKGSRSLNLTEFGKLHAVRSDHRVLIPLLLPMSSPQVPFTFFFSIQFLTSVTASFNYFDTTKRGALNEDSLSLALRHAGQQVSIINGSYDAKAC